VLESGKMGVLRGFGYRNGVKMVILSVFTSRESFDFRTLINNIHKRFFNSRKRPKKRIKNRKNECLEGFYV
jgi:hypothetical protein